MSTQMARGPALRGYRRRKAVLDLNVPPCESRDREGTSTEVRSHDIQASQQEQQSIAHAPIDVEAIDDDVIESSARAFAEAKSNSQRNRGRTVVVDVDSGGTRRMTQNNHNMRNVRRRVPPNRAIIICDLINLESASNTLRERVTTPPPSPPPPPPPPKELTFTCPICIGPLVEETTTKCGHIFCKTCIKSAIASKNKCPACRKKITVKELIRVFLPATSCM